MSRRAIMPESLRQAAETLRMSPGLLAGDYLFLTGATGGGADGVMPDDPGQQTRNAFDKIGQILAEAGLGFDALVEMTSYHIGLRAHFDRFDEIRCHYCTAPFPAWTAVEVAGLRREGAVIEIRAIAYAGGRASDV